MFYIDSNKCTGCGICVDACWRGAINTNNDLAVINQELCIQCGAWARICPNDAI